MHLTHKFPKRRILLCAALLLGNAPTILAADGTLALYANGESLATEGFVAPELTRDGWALRFAHVLVTLSDVTALQTDPPYDATSGTSPAATQTLPYDMVQNLTVDLATPGDDGRVLVATLAAPSGHYNAVTWSVVPATEGPWTGKSLVLIGTASRDGQVLPFTLTSEDAQTYTCGEYVGDQRKGFVTDGGHAELELTFHLDHIFGRHDMPPDAAINLGALGFDAVAAGGPQTLDLAGLHLGHVGEGHCAVSAR